MRLNLASDKTRRSEQRYRFTPLVSWSLGGLFAAGFAFSVMVILKSDYLARGRDLTAQEEGTITICAIAAALTVLICWWLQRFAASRNLAVRALYGLAMLIIVYGSVGGALVIMHNYFVYAPEIVRSSDLLTKGYYWDSLSGFYTFALFIFSAFKPSLLALFAAGGLYLALAGPQIARPSSGTR